ncbi:DNA-processing protein DprA [Peribacillus frigoritolerans]|nr:DNA-processing protein DprA [Peribacillus frigoritolerans]
MLKQIFDPPWVLYFKGDKKLLTRKNTLGVVGTRKPTSYGLEALETILLPLVKKKVRDRKRSGGWNRCRVT